MFRRYIPTQCLRNDGKVTFSGEMAQRRGQRITYITERCVIDLVDDGLVVREIAPGIDLKRDVLDLADFPLRADANLTLMDEALFRDAPMGLRLSEKTHG